MSRANNSSPGSARYYLVLRNNQLWPAVLCDDEMTPSKEKELRPSGRYQPVLLMAVFEFKWVRPSDLVDFDPSEIHRIDNESDDGELIKAYEAVLGSADKPEHPSFPDLNFWRSELLMRDLGFRSDESEEEPKPGSSLDKNKRSWTERSEANALGEEHSPKKAKTEPKKAKTEPKKAKTKPKKAKTEPKKKKAEPKKKKPQQWMPDEDDNEDAPEPGYFDKITKEYNENRAARARVLSSGLGPGSGDGSSTNSSDDEDDDAFFSSPAPAKNGDRGRDFMSPTSRGTSNEIACQTDTARFASTIRPAANYQTDIETFLKTGEYEPHLLGDKLNGITTRRQREDEVLHSSKIMDTARGRGLWELADLATAKLLALFPWSPTGTIIVAKLAFRAQRTDQVCDSLLRDTVVQHIAEEEEGIRKGTPLLDVVLKDHDDLAEMVYLKKLNSLRRKRGAAEIEGEMP